MLEGLGPLDMTQAVAPVKVGRPRDGRICVCGHGAGNHAIVESEHRGVALHEAPQGSVACSAGRHQCACSKFYPVLVTDDNRRFMSKTVGPGADHALARGVNNAVTAGVSVRWRDDLACGKCQTAGVPLLPVAVKMGYNGPMIVRETSEYNYLLCADCRAEVPLETDPDTLANVSVPGNRSA